MASVLDQRNIIVQQNIPKLIKVLTNFNSKDDNYKSCLQFCFSHFKHHRYLSVNSHEVKRDVDGICEKLRFSNLHETEKKFKKLVEETITHELCVNHYEKDVIYSILNLLTTVAYDPIGNLNTKLRKGQEIMTFRPKSLKTPKKATDQFISSLLKDNFKLQKNETDSELSEWTSSEDDSDDTQSDATVDEVELSPSKTLFGSCLKPPQKPKVFGTLILEDSEKWLEENIQNSWWNDEITSSIEINSENVAANFCVLWQKHLTDKSLGFIKPRPFSLVSEYCLLREIFWMFSNPVDCKFFKFDEDEIVLRSNVTLPSTMPESLNIFLIPILRSINLMYHLRSACLKSFQNSSLSHTLETYYGIVQNITDRILEFVLEEEVLVKSQKETYTLVIFYNKLRPHSKMLEMIWQIHQSSVLDSSKFPPHICATYLLASLNNEIKSSCIKEQKNLAIVLLMACLRTFLEIFETWWTQARLDDLKNEFLMEKSEDDMILPRMFEKSKEKSFYLNENVSAIIIKDRIIDSMLNFSMKASFTLDIIRTLDRVHEIRQIVDNSATLFEEFTEKIRDEIRKFSQHPQQESRTVEDHKIPESKNQKLIEDIKRDMLANGDDLMLLVFQSTFDALTSTPTIDSTSTHIELLDILNKATDHILIPLEYSIERVINELLQRKISIAEQFVMNIYLNEFNVEQHLQEIRKVFFVESFELMNFFYTKLFPQIENGDSTWASSYLLTVALNDAVSTNRVFSVHVKRKFSYDTVFEAVDGLTLNYNVNENLVHIFSPNLMEKYNAVFKFLLKIKYAQNNLNVLRFPAFFKHRAPYAKLTMIDLVIKRLSLTRFAMLHTINSLHNHITVLLGALNLQLKAKIAKSQNISELIAYHGAYVEAFSTKAFLEPESSRLYGIIIETLKLARTLKEEFLICSSFALLDEQGSVDTISLQDLDNNAIAIEKAFGVCEYQLKVLLDV